MGALDDLAAALYGQQIQKAISADNNYTQLAQVPDAISGLITNAAVQTPGKYDTKDIILGALLSGTTSGLLSGAGENYQNVLTKRYQDAVTESAKGNEPENQGLSPSLFKSAKDAGSLFRTKSAQESIDLQKAGILERIKAKNSELGKLDAYDNGNDSPSDNIMNPKVQKTRQMEGDARQSLQTVPLSTNFGDLKSNFENMVSNYKYNDKASTLAFVSSFARVLDPGSTVKEGEIKNAENTQGFLQSLGYNMTSLLNGSQNIGADTKQQMIRSAASKYNVFGSAYQDFVAKQQDLISKQGGKKDSVFGVYDFKPFNFDEWAGSNAGKNLEQTTVKDELNKVKIQPLQAKLEAILQKAQSGVALSADDQATIDEARSLMSN